ncbi:SPFH domain-containing protein [Arcanobacterium hippocoleae]|uniref:Membrane protease subunit (Stomatin/prohibitin family) n=1 Tax=Arcanobacterium hippocoleae TaxID=149017 RepID=A0ABU1T080_9ACTO|nr:SPFH domain-containing protein [Arcanobacterium hippocoleae]MDR6938792.1 membrane protease subunit (stomatin/prohibitin family) [Arcanobacterium hippocoleae]
MGFIQALAGAIGGTFADQWKDFYGPVPSLPPTAGVFPGILMGTNNNRGANYKGNQNIITNGSKIIVPEGTAVITMQDGGITGCITQPGAYTYTSNDPNATSIFAGDGIIAPLVKQSFEKFKYGGIPAAQQLLFYVNLKEIPNNRFGTQSEIYWDDAYLGTQVGAITRGTYTLRIVDPILFVKNFVPVTYLTQTGQIFDFADLDNPAGEQLFSEVVGSLSAAFSNYTNNPDKGNRMARIQADQLGFAASLSGAVEDAYQWKTSRGLEIIKTAILAIEYDEATKQLLQDVKKADALSGNRANTFFQQATARGIQAAGENGGGTDMAFLGMGVNAVGNMMGNVVQPNNGFVPNQNSPQTQAAANNFAAAATDQPAQNSENVTAKLLDMKKLLDAGVLTQEEFDAVKKQLLGL